MKRKRKGARIAPEAGAVVGQGGRTGEVQTTSGDLLAEFEARMTARLAELTNRLTLLEVGPVRRGPGRPRKAAP